MNNEKNMNENRRRTKDGAATDKNTYKDAAEEKDHGNLKGISGERDEGPAPASAPPEPVTSATAAALAEITRATTELTAQINRALSVGTGLKRSRESECDSGTESSSDGDDRERRRSPRRGGLAPRRLVFHGPKHE